MFNFLDTTILENDYISKLSIRRAKLGIKILTAKKAGSF